MRKVKITLLFCLVFILMAVIPNTAVQADPLFSADQSFLLVSKKHPVPFKASIKAMITNMVPDSELPLMYVTVNGNGNATHLGKIGFHLEEVINLVSYTSDQSIRYTAANGDMLFVHAISNLIPLSATVFNVQGAGSITGGTGRFEGATGNLQVNAVVNLATSDVQASVSGNIKY